jgi:hypothetical protein
MRRFFAWTAAALLLCTPIGAQAQNARATLEGAAKALSTVEVKSLEVSGSGIQFQAGQSYTDNLKQLNLAVDRLLPLHGRMVPIADLHTAVGHGH